MRLDNKRILQEEEKFITGFGLPIPKSALVTEIMRYMQEDIRRHYKIIIGSDSELLADRTADFVTAIVVHRVGCGGRYFWRRLERGNFHTLRDRIISEAILSLETAKELLMGLREASRATQTLNEKMPDWDFEIHVDIGEGGETKTMIQEIVGMIRASNFEVKTKPWSYAATKVADRHV
jgi:predicted RNase H-related nuclease YkuK (DUF458 family)